VTILRTLARLLSLGMLCWALPVLAQTPGADDARYVADIELQTSAELGELLQRAGQLLVEGIASQDGAAKVTFVLHGPVIRDLLRQNYPANRELVDLAASLTALRVVDIKVCRTWMGINGVDEGDLQPFVEPVNLARSEVRRLRAEQGYLDF